MPAIGQVGARSRREAAAYGCVRDFDDDPFPSPPESGGKKMWDRGLNVGVFSFTPNPRRAVNDPVDIDHLRSGETPTKQHFYRQMDRMAANLQWLKDQGSP